MRNTPLEEAYADEMDRRQKWDRDFEHDMLYCSIPDEDHKVIKKTEEDNRRREWDLEHMQVTSTKAQGIQGDVPGV